MDQVFQKLLGIFRDVLDDDNLELTRDSTADHVDGWDSLAQVRILIAAEKAFNLRLDLDEINDLPNVGALVDTIHRKLNVG
jgi:acyl carrier protein